MEIRKTRLGQQIVTQEIWATKKLFSVNFDDLCAGHVFAVLLHGRVFEASAIPYIST